MRPSELYSSIFDRSVQSARDEGLKEENFNIVNEELKEGVNGLREAFSEYNDLLRGQGLEKSDDRVSAEEILESKDYSREAVRSFLFELSNRDHKYRDPSQDVFASAVITKLQDERISLRSEPLSGLSGLGGFGNRNLKDITLIGDVECDLFHKNRGGSSNVKGDVDGKVGLGMEGGNIKVEGFAEVVGCGIREGYIEVEKGAKHLGRDIKGGEVGSKGDVKTLASHASGGIAWVDGNAETVGAYAKGGLIYVSEDAERVGEASEGGRIYVEGEISQGDIESGATVYSWDGDDWEVVFPW